MGSANRISLDAGFESLTMVMNVESTKELGVDLRKMVRRAVWSRSRPIVKGKSRRFSRKLIDYLS
jgi:hypothetical protein